MESRFGRLQACKVRPIGPFTLSNGQGPQGPQFANAQPGGRNSSPQMQTDRSRRAPGVPVGSVGPATGAVKAHQPRLPTASLERIFGLPMGPLPYRFRRPNEAGNWVVGERTGMPRAGVSVVPPGAANSGEIVILGAVVQGRGKVSGPR